MKPGSFLGTPALTIGVPSKDIGYKVGIEAEIPKLFLGQIITVWYTCNYLVYSIYSGIDSVCTFAICLKRVEPSGPKLSILLFFGTGKIFLTFTLPVKG